ncbi:MAG TPA: ribulokinase [Methylomirabilota bacterium]|nr:ribulokinase [Methylomirabilota bacterium]
MKSARSVGKRSARYTVGIDFGTLSGRAVLVDVDTGEEVATAVHEYEHGVIEEHLPGSRRRLRPDTALQDPADYLRVLELTIPRILRQAGVRPAQVVGVGTDFTSCTLLPTRADGRPLCFDRRWRGNPHAWVKLWKHHAAQPEAHRITALARERREQFISAYGGRYSSEWFFAKVLETVNQAPAVYDAAERFIEAGDWIVWMLCGKERRCVSAAGFKAMWVCPSAAAEADTPSEPVRAWTYPDPPFFRALHPKLEHVVRDKLTSSMWPLGTRAGGLTAHMARRVGLLPGTPVATGNIDAHVAVPACRVTTPGKLVMIMGTSTCHLVLSESRRVVEGACGVVRDGVVPGYWGYEAGQAGVGDLFAWFAANGVPAAAAAEARRAGLDVFAWLEQQAAGLRPGESGLLALDWWAGCRSVLMDSDLNGLLVGATVATRPHEIYRALMEATAFGTRKIIEAFNTQGVAIDELYACGGLALKSPLLMQLYADITGRTIRLARSEQTCALGAAMQAAVAAGVYRDIHSAARKMAHLRPGLLKPNPAHKAVYDELYAEYNRLHDLFGRDPASVMKVLKRLRLRALGVT